MKKGHPWIIEDQYTEKFHPRDRFIIATERRRPCALFIHDPRHASIKARMWAPKGDFGRLIKSFRNDLIIRMQKSIKKRQQKGILEERNNFYLIFGEADHLPGLHVQFLNGEILIQYYTYFWENYSDFVITNLQKIMSNTFNMDVTKSDFWEQHRADSGALKEPAKSLNPNMSFKKIDITEYGVNYQIELGRNYDSGIYTDMSSVRGHLKPEFEKATKVLNLYSNPFRLKDL
jgi:23S rRNA (cytosine1962-C5)-methyltransferase